MEQEIRLCTTSDGVRIAYSAIGEGPPVVWVPGWVSHLELDWEIPPIRTRWEAYAEQFTLIRLDKRGTGLSDRKVHDYSLEARVRDLEAVVDHLKLRRFALVGYSEGGPICMAYAAAYPRRVSRLVLIGTFARGDEVGGSQELRDGLLAIVKAEWGLGSKVMSDLFLGDSASPASQQVLTEYQRRGASAEDAYAMALAILQIDVGPLLAKIKAPTLVITARDDRTAPVELGRKIAAGISGARFLSIEGGHVPLGEHDVRMHEAVRSFLLEEQLSAAKPKRAVESPSSAPLTILFTDMASSTALTQRLGDAKAQEILRTHNTIVREALKAHDGSEIKHTGDGIMASFAASSKALECAVAIQRAVAAYVEEHPEVPLGVHIGLNTGEPIAEDEDLFGTAVQLAARIAAKAAGGEILASDVVRQLVAGKGFLFADRGETALRGFEDPVRLYEVRWQE